MSTCNLLSVLLANVLRRLVDALVRRGETINTNNPKSDKKNINKYSNALELTLYLIYLICFLGLFCSGFAWSVVPFCMIDLGVILTCCSYLQLVSTAL